MGIQPTRATRTLAVTFPKPFRASIRFAAQMLLTEVGPDLSQFPTAGAFCSWLRLCPEPKISRRKVLSSKRRPSALINAVHS
jgi:hypothetical protein